MKYFGTNGKHKDFKVVAGEEISYRMKGLKGMSWDWKLGDGTCANTTEVAAFNHFWQLALDNPQNPQAGFSSKGKQVRTSAQLPSSNQDFGPTYGTILVTADGVHDCSGKAQVFYNKDDKTNPSGMAPNWFYYWSQIPAIQSLLTIPGISLWKPFDVNDPNNPNNCSFVPPLPSGFTLDLNYAGYPYSNSPGVGNTYGNQNFGVHNMKWEPLVEDPLNSGSPHNCGFSTSNIDQVAVSYGVGVGVINIGQGCGFRKELADGTKINGVYVFYSTVLHEVEHALIDCQLWANGYTTAQDADRDGYPTMWEMTPQNGIVFTPLGTYGTPPFDQYGRNKNTGAPESYDSKQLGMGKYSAGTEYEEARCRQKEVAMKTQHSSLLDGSDWSYDNGKLLGETNQGKQW